MKDVIILAAALLFIFIATVAFSKYDRHDGSQYSCNEINSERAWAKKHDRKAFIELEKEYKKYCK